MWLLRTACLSLIISLIENQGAGALRILGIFPGSGKSHYIIGEHLLKELAKRGHSVDVLSHFPQKNKLHNFTDISLAGSAPIAVNNITFETAMQFNIGTLDFLVKNLGLEICDLLGHPEIQKLMKTPKGTYDVIIVELFLAQCYLAFGQQLGTPMVALVTSKLYDWLYEPFGNTLNPSYTPSLFSGTAQRMTFFERLENTLVANFVYYHMNYYLNYEIQQVERYFNRKLSSLTELYDDVSLVLVNGHFSLNEIRPVTPDIIDIGGLHVHDSDERLTPELEKWLDESADGCVYFTFGSMVRIETAPERVLKIFYETFERIKPVRVLLKIADVSALPAGLPENVKTSPWLPQIAVLKHKNTKAFITHGGLLGAQEALAHKVPMIALPIFGDQYPNIKSFEHRRIAIALSLDALTTESLTSAVEAIMTDPTYRENINKISDLFFDRPMSPMETAVYWVEFTARQGKVLKSPATALTWWQFHSLDVYGFIILSLLLIFYVIKYLLEFLGRLVRNSFARISKSKKNS